MTDIFSSPIIKHHSKSIVPTAINMCAPLSEDLSDDDKMEIETPDIIKTPDVSPKARTPSTAHGRSASRPPQPPDFDDSVHRAFSQPITDVGGGSSTSASGVSEFDILKQALKRPSVDIATLRTGLVATLPEDFHTQGRSLSVLEAGYIIEPFSGS